MSVGLDSTSLVPSVPVSSVPVVTPQAIDPATGQPVPEGYTVNKSGKVVKKRDRKAKGKIEAPDGGFTTDRIDAFRFRITETPQPSDFNGCTSNLSVLHCRFMAGQYAEQLIAYYTKLGNELESMTPEQRKEAGEVKRQMTMARKAIETHGVKILAESMESLKADNKAEIEEMVRMLSAKLASM